MTANIAFLQTRVDAASDRLDGILAQYERREREQLARENAERERAAVERARADSERKREIQSSYNDTFLAFGSQCPAPADDVSPQKYRRQLFDALRRKLAPSHELATLRSDEVSSGPEVFNVFEDRLLEAARAEAERPSVENLPRDGSMISRVRVDQDSGAKETHYFGRESFIKALSTPGRRVVCLRNPRTGEVLIGRPPAIASTFR